ncbi:hypothetical protein Ancab_012982 [Ancistrocladus abbreviatus]
MVDCDWDSLTLSPSKASKTNCHHSPPPTLSLCNNSMTPKNGEIISCSTASATTAFSRFDIVSDDSDHHYSKSSKASNRFTSMTSAVHKKIMQEWKILDKNLLDSSIYVRAYEHRLDLLRAAIIGTAGTPYHDALFFFDIAFPSDYPNHPPLVHYRSCGFRLNPNLYPSGRVCLSLLNTWTGKKSEKWDPSRSTIFQVLLSIQALVLNAKPYFNEPGYSAWSGRTYWEKKSLSYNEDVFLLCCKTTLCLLRNPPRNFEPLVNGHFRDRASMILAACNAYRNGDVRVGYYGKALVSTEVPSSKFKALMDQMYGQLVASFARNGASVGHFVEQLRVEKQAKREAADGNGVGAKVETKSAQAGLKKRFLDRIKKILVGLRKGKKAKNAGVMGVNSS